MTKRSRVRSLIDSQHVKGSERLLKSAPPFLVIFFDISERQLARKILLSSILNLDTFCEHINTRWQLISLNKSECLRPPIQMHLSQNQKKISEFFSAFPECT